MFKLNILNYKINSYILLFFSLTTVLFEVSLYNKLFFIVIFIFSITQNLKKYNFKIYYSSMIAIIAIYLQFKLSDNTLSKEFFLNLVLILIFIKFSEIKNKDGHYFFNYTVIFLSIATLIYGQDFISSINSFLLIFFSITHLYSLNQQKLIKLRYKYIFRYLLISLGVIPIIILIYFLFPRYELNIKLFDSTKNNLGIPEKLELGSFTDISNNQDVVFLYNNNIKKGQDAIYFRVKIFDLMDTNKTWVTTPSKTLNMKFSNDYEIIKSNITSNKKHKLIIYPNDKNWLPVLKKFKYESFSVSNNYLSGTAESKKKLNKKKSYSIVPYKLDISYNDNFLQFYKKLPPVFSEKLINWSNEIKTKSKSDLDYLKNLMSYFGNGDYFYNLSPVINKRNDYEEFFFKNKSGYCEYYAGMLTILARLQGIPARIVTGYLGGQYNELGNFYTFKQSDAHSWVEVYFKDKGWVSFDPTLAIPNKNIVSFNNTSLERLQSNNINKNNKISKIGLIKLYYNYFDYTWTNKFLDYNQQSRSKFIKENFENIKFNNKSYIYLFIVIFVLFFYKLFELIFKKKLFFSIFFRKIRSKNIDINKTMTHQEIYNFLKKEERLKLNELFEVYEKINFSDKFNLNLKKFFYYNYKIMKFYIMR